MQASLVLGQPNFTTNTSANGRSGLSSPYGITFDSSGDLWVTDSSNSRILEFTPPFSSGMNATLVIGHPDLTGGPPGVNASALAFPSDLVFDSSGDLWVCDSSNNRVLEFKPPFTSGMNASLVIGQSGYNEASPEASQSGLSGPSQIAFDSSGDLWVAEYGNNRVTEFTPPFTSGMDASLVLGQEDFTSNVPGNGSAGLWGPNALGFDPSGNLWVGDWFNGRILGFSPPFATDMNASLVIGQPDLTTTGRSLSTQNGFYGIYSIAFDASGNLWMADGQDNKSIGNNRVLEFIAPLSDGIDASVVIGQPDFASDSTATTQAGLDSPEGVAFDPSGNLWVADSYNNRVLEFNGTAPVTTTSTTTSTTATPPPTPQTVTVTTTSTSIRNVTELFQSTSSSPASGGSASTNLLSWAVIAVVVLVNVAAIGMQLVRRSRSKA